MSMFFTTYESVTIVVLMVIAVTFGVFMYGQTLAALQDVRETGKLLTSKVYFHEILTASCLNVNNTKNEPSRYIFDANQLDKLNNKDISCFNSEEKLYRVNVEEINVKNIDNSKEWNFGKKDLKFQINQTINIFDEGKVHIGFVKFSICEPEECECETKECE